MLCVGVSKGCSGRVLLDEGQNQRTMQMIDGVKYRGNRCITLPSVRLVVSSRDRRPLILCD